MYSESRATDTQVMRCLSEHNGWYVPAGFAVTQLNTTLSEHAIIFSTEFEAQPDRLLLFTDAVAAHRADGHRIGLFMSAFRGSQIFAAVDGRFESVSINPGSPQSESWYIQRDAFPLTNLWGQVVELETALRADSGSPDSFARLAAHPGLILLVNEQNQPIQA
ncbi:MAG: hypothetical protein ABI823_15895, partial [Bryobacteraceae bacterium]